MESYEIYLLIIVGILALCGILELIAYIIKNKYTNKETGMIIDEPGKFDAGDAYHLIDVILDIIYFFLDALSHSGGSSGGHGSRGSRSGGSRSSGSRRGGGGRGSGGGGGRR